MSNGHEPPYVRLDAEGLEKVFDKMKSFASKKSLEQVADRVPSKQKQEYWDNKADKSDIPSAIVPDISASATVDSTSSETPSVEVVKTGTDEEPSFAFNFHGIRGSEGPSGPSGSDGVSPDVSIETITDGHRVTITDKDHPTGQSFDVMDGSDGSAGQPGVDGVSPTVAITAITDGHTVTITDKDHPSGQSFNVMDGSDGSAGPSGADGYSPAVTITSITGGHEVKITDKDHPTGQSFNVMDGSDGATGPAGPGVPSGGTAGQVLSKVDGTDFNTAWTTPGGGGGTTIPYINTWDSSSTSSLWKASNVPGVTAYTEGMLILIMPRNLRTNPSGTLKININSLGDKTIRVDPLAWGYIGFQYPILLVYKDNYFYSIDAQSAYSVKQQNSYVNSDYRVLLSGGANDTTSPLGANKSSKLTFNPSTGALVVTGSIEANSVGTNLAAAIQQLIPGGGGQQILCTSEIPHEPMSGVYEFNTAYIEPSIASDPKAGDALICADGWIYFISSVSGSTITATERFAFSGGGGGGNETLNLGEATTYGGGQITGLSANYGSVIPVATTGSMLPLSYFQIYFSNPNMGDIATLTPFAYKVEANNVTYPSLTDYFTLGNPQDMDYGTLKLYVQTAVQLLYELDFSFIVNLTDSSVTLDQMTSYQQVNSIV